jgi:hypothetical protein
MVQFGAAQKVQMKGAICWTEVLVPHPQVKDICEYGFASKWLPIYATSDGSHLCKLLNTIHLAMHIRFLDSEMLNMNCDKAC